MGQSFTFEREGNNGKKGDLHDRQTLLVLYKTQGNKGTSVIRLNGPERKSFKWDSYGKEKVLHSSRVRVRETKRRKKSCQKGMEGVEG